MGRRWFEDYVNSKPSILENRFMIKNLLFINIIMLIISFYAMADEISLKSLLPEKIDAWSLQDKDEFYDRKTIFHYMNGAGEIYLAYDFQKLLVREYKKESKSSIIAELYLMSSSEDAYGVFSFDTDGEEINLGQGAVYGAGLLRFWKDRVFVRLFAEYETDESKNAVISLAKKIVDNISTQGKKPALLDCLPVENLLRDIHYFHKQVILNSLYYISDSNILGLSENTESVLARYQYGQDKLRLLVIHYKKSQEAKTAYRRFIEAYFPEKSEANSPMTIGKVENERFVSIRKIKNFVILIFESPDEEKCKRLTDDLIKNLEEVFVWTKKSK